MKNPKDELTVGLVGPCKSGKTLLKRKLGEKGYSVKHIAQEHSYVPDMWLKIAKPDLLIYLEVSYPETLKRSTLGWSEKEYTIQISRLEHAYQHADLVINTSELSPQQVLEIALEFLTNFKSGAK